MEGRTALHVAAAEGNSEVVKYLLEKGGDIFAEDGYKRTALDCAIHGGHMKVANVLQSHGSRLEQSTIRLHETLSR